MDFYVIAVNPYPWKVPPLSVGRKGSKYFVRAGRDEGLHTYKQAVSTELKSLNPRPLEGPVALMLWFYRNVPEYTNAGGRRVHKNFADATNMQKATEDALQGILFKNDSMVQFVSSQIVEQGPEAPSLLVIGAWEMDRIPVPVTFPDRTKWEVDEIIARGTYREDGPSSFSSASGVPF